MLTRQGILVSVLSALLSAFICLPFSSSANTLNDSEALSAGLTDLVYELNKRTPLRVDADTRLDSVATFSNYMIYNNTMTDLSADDVNAALVAQYFDENMIQHLCSLDTFQPFIELELVMVYRYTDKHGKFITELSKDLSGCK